MPGARSKRCRQARPLTRLGRLEERERPGDFSGSSMQDQVALGALALTQSCQGRHRPRPLARCQVGFIVSEALLRW
jgi:hypothetical protein